MVSLHIGSHLTKPLTPQVIKTIKVSPECKINKKNFFCQVLNCVGTLGNDAAGRATIKGQKLSDFYTTLTSSWFSPPNQEIYYEELKSLCL